MDYSHKQAFISFLLATAIAVPSLGQFDDLPDDFPPPPPPPMDDMDFPPPPSFEPPTFSPPSVTTPPPPTNPSSSFSNSTGGGGSSSTSNTSGGSSGNGNASILSKNQRDRLAKAPLDEITDKNFPETIDSFDFPNAELVDIVKAIGELTGKNFIIDPGVRGKITIIAPTKITVAEAYRAFLSALQINGMAVVPSGSFYKIRSARNAQRDGIETYSGNYFPNSDQMITRIIHMKHIQAEQVNRDLRLLISKDGEISPYAATNSLIISDYGANIERIMRILEQLDVPGFEDQLEVIPIKYAKAKDIADLVNKIVNKGETPRTGAQGGGAFSAGVPRFNANTQRGNNNNQNTAYFMVIPDERSNALVVVGNKAGITRIKKLLEQLDFRIRPEESGGVNVYYVKHGDAEKIAQTLSGVAKDASPRPGGAGGREGFTSPFAPPPAASASSGAAVFGGDVKITSDKATNSLIVVASKQDYEVVLALLSKIDIPRDQVYVETVIMELKVTDGFDYQVGYLQFDASGAKAGFNGFSGTSLADLLKPAGGQGAILGFGSGSKVSIKDLEGKTTELPSVLSFMNFLKKTGKANVLSTPAILAMDNEESEIEVGDRVVVGVTQTAGTATTQSVSSPQFDDATIKMTIKPFISTTTNTIRMELTNSVKQPSVNKAPKNLQDVTQQLATRKLKTNIVVPDGDTAVLGGLMKEDEIETVNKVPLLGDIPILGWLFRSRSNTKEKTNLMVLLTPKIIRSRTDAHGLFQKKADERLEFIKGAGGLDPYGRKMDELKNNNTRAKSEPLTDEETR